MTALLSVTSLQVSYAGARALWDVNLEVNAGEVVALLGANGAGKTTTLRAISGLQPVLAGTVCFDGRRVTSSRPEVMVALGVLQVPEGRQLWPEMSVLENLELGAYPPHARPRKDESLERVFEMFPRLRDRRDQQAGTLSGGEQQMCAIGRALMGLPRLLMLDEPSLGLAPMLVREVFDTVQRTVHEGLTVLLVEQNITEALNIADRGYVLETGRTTLTGTGQELLADDHVRRTYLGVD